MQQEPIAVIVPIYNAEKYVAKCIESILAQTHSNLRLILVDDGTPDGAGEICDEYAKKDPRITVIHQQNAGATHARARGVEAAAGCGFITFVDSDDTIAPDCLLTLHNAICENTDIVINRCGTAATNILRDEYLRSLIAADGSTGLELWGKLFRRELFNAHTFEIPRNIVVGEDMLMNIRLAFASTRENVATINAPGIYNYRQNDESIMHSFKSTPQYEHLFHQSLKESIPSEVAEKYLEFTISNRLKSFKRFWGKKINVTGMKETPFYLELKNDIDRSGYHLTAIQRTLFTSESSIVRLFAIIARGVMKIFH